MIKALWFLVIVANGIDPHYGAYTAQLGPFTESACHQLENTRQIDNDSIIVFEYCIKEPR